MEKIKHFLESKKGEDILIVIIIILVGLGSFELGRLSKENKNSGIRIEYPNQEPTQEANTLKSFNSQKSKKLISKRIFASNKGSKYYYTSCGAGKTIKEKNKVYFNTSSEAEKAGYKLSSSCK